MAPNNDNHMIVEHVEDEDHDEITTEKIQIHHLEAAAHELNKIDLDKLSSEALSWKSRATIYLLGCILVQGLSMSIDLSSSSTMDVY